MLHTPPQRNAFLSRQELALIGVMLLWCGTFLIVYIAVDHTSPLFFVGLRFVAAGLLSMIVFRRACAA